MTVHDTRFIRPMLRWLATRVYRWCGWTVEGKAPEQRKCVIIAAPHTSNWDFFYTLCLAFILRLKPTIMMKSDWFFWPMGPVFRWLGAIPVDRRSANNMVAQSIAAFAQREGLMLVVPPSGTRGKVVRWKTGFYHIAHGAGVPILMGFLDYQRKAGGLGPLFNPTGDIDRDMPEIRHFYRHVSGKHPHLMAADPADPSLADLSDNPLPATVAAIASDNKIHSPHH